MVSAIVLSYKRRNNIPRIISHLLSQPFISEIIIKDGLKDDLVCYGRYEAALRAKNETIYVQDDDCIVSGIKDVYGRFQGQITYGCTEGYLKDKNRHFGDMELALVGWGCFFPKKAVGVLNQYVKKYGKDKVFLREADRIFTLLQRKPHLAVPTAIEHLSGFDDETAMSSQEEHLESKKLAIKRCLDL
ncbi:MAG: hypothetical protein PHF35_04790 [Candidatus Moranbacteria bacterium]|nr:hypothetical protein [Candidatus Moranbacteria bacterium]